MHDQVHHLDLDPRLAQVRPQGQSQVALQTREAAVERVGELHIRQQVAQAVVAALFHQPLVVGHHLGQEHAQRAAGQEVGREPVGDVRHKAERGRQPVGLQGVLDHHPLEKEMRVDDRPRLFRGSARARSRAGPGTTRRTAPWRGERITRAVFS